MEVASTVPARVTPAAPWWWRALGYLLRPWIRIRTEPERPIEVVVAGRPICYMLEQDGITHLSILEDACRDAGLPSPLAPMADGLLDPSRAVLALSRRPGLLSGRRRVLAQSGRFARLLATVAANPELDVQLVPVSIFVGRAPSRTQGWFRVLFSENWVMVGRFRRLLSILLNGRDTIVHFSPPVSLREVVAEGLTPERTVRKAQRVLRAHFRRVRTAVIGPDLSHRRTLIDDVLNSAPVRSAIEQLAVKESIPFDQAFGRAREYAWEIAADYSQPVVRSLSFMLRPLWNQLYGGVSMYHFDTVKQVAPGHEVIYVPCHRSHIDYLLLSYQLYVNGLVPPHIAAGVNLNLPVVGPILRRGGAFFLRRSFKSNPLYAVVFSEYVAQLFARGVSMEYFIEGGRSRTGRLLEARGGMLAITLRSYLRESRRPVVFQPVYIGYEKLLEGGSYISELSGKPKEKESLLGLFKAFSLLRERYGRVALSFGEPIFLAEHLDTAAPGWRESASMAEERPPWFAGAVSSLADRILVHINEAAHVNPVNLTAIALLSTPRHAMGEPDLRAALALIRTLIQRSPYSERVTVTDLEPDAIIAYVEKLGMVGRVAHPLGDVIRAERREAVLLSYFRNNMLHLVATSAWVACCFLNNRRLRRSTVERLGEVVYPFLKRELFLPWDAAGFSARVRETIDLFVELGLLKLDADGRMLRRRVGQTDAAFQLRVVSQTLVQAFERYYIAIAVLAQHGPRVLASGELENLCHLTAQRLALLYERTAPEFFDRSLFRGFIATLKEHRIVWIDEAGKLDYGDALAEMGKDARLILSRELRHSILKLTQTAATSDDQDIDDVDDERPQPPREPAA
jgi:glycerol-3-phosphate O-acyltransferase